MFVLGPNFIGELSEWLKEHAWKACVPERVPRVRIPHSPPSPAVALAKVGFACSYRFKCVSQYFLWALVSCALASATEHGQGPLQRILLTLN